MKQDWIGVSPAFMRMQNAARMVAATDVAVLLIGEPGSGRSTLAGQIHAWSPRSRGPLVPFHCAGASVGALDEAIGAASRATPGATLILDEVAELGAEDQARLLHLLAAADLGRQGVPRVIAISAVDLRAATVAGRFRRDLELRLSVVPIEVPPLRDRVLDIPALIAHFIAAAAERHRVQPPRLSTGAERLFRLHLWPGNLRELANLCERLTILLPGVQVVPENLPREMFASESAGQGVGGFLLPPKGIDLNGLEAELIRQALALAGGNKTRAARLLGLSRDTFLYRIRKHLILA